MSIGRIKEAKRNRTEKKRREKTLERINETIEIIAKVVKRKRKKRGGREKTKGKRRRMIAQITRITMTKRPKSHRP